ncbi:CoA-disulfide reductase [Cutibacterium sp. WCA-380-WT-3A]|uniref:CoA-disulfide reductase n=1 Tax=Cutibacterium porci TaxID=2605781 RepID=A0A7K0J8N1_9ACTN|nr:FAD-dependent oxidoreductase [Cutibacterium porci]MSS46311.1 CoA-disulfide reductase [Cutibacterium porci]
MHVVCVGGSDAGISAALRARELDPSTHVTVVVADAYPNFSVCGIPYYISGEVSEWHRLAHRTRTDLQDAGLQLLLGTRATRIDVDGRELEVVRPDGGTSLISYDELVVATGAQPVRPPITGLDVLGAADGVHLLHSMGDMFILSESLKRLRPRTAMVVGAGYIGLEMAEGLTARGIDVTQVEAASEVLPTVDEKLGSLLHKELEHHGVDVHTGTSVTGIQRRSDGLHVTGQAAGGGPLSWNVELVLVAVGVRPDASLLLQAGVQSGPHGAVIVDDTMATGVPHVWAAGDCVATHHRLLGTTYLPLGTTSHKQGRIAGENVLGGTARFAGSLGTQVVKVFDLVAARTGLHDREAIAAGFDPASTTTFPDDHKAYYPGAHPIAVHVTGDRVTGRLLGAQLVGHRSTQAAKRVDIYATAIFHGMDVASISDLDLAYTPPFGSTWDAVQIASQAWVAQYQS